MIAKSFVDELVPRNIRVNAVWPGIVATERVKRILEGKEPDVSSLALKRVGEPHEFGRMVTVLHSPVTSLVSGAVIGIDGGTVKALQPSQRFLQLS